MSRICFIVLPIFGPINSTLGLAKSLKQRGHNVCYINPGFKFDIGIEEHIRSQGLEFIDTKELTYNNKQTTVNEQNGKGNESNKLLKLLARQLKLIQAQKVSIKTYKNFYRVHRAARQSLKILQQQLTPNLLIVDSELPAIALEAYCLGLKTITINTSHARYMDRNVPPFETTLIPQNNIISTLIIYFNWYKLFIIWGISSLIGFSLDRKNPNRLLRNLLLKRLANKYNFPISRIDMKCLGPSTINFPELILYPEEFDFPRPTRKLRHYIGPFVDLQRKDQPQFPWDRLEPGKPLIFCSIGTLNVSYKITKLFLQKIIKAVSERQDFQMVMSIGNYMQVNDFEPVPQNIIVNNIAPQIEILKRAALMITHGGLVSIKECISLGIPMIVFPFEWDQPGNAARVVYHGLGLMGNLKSTSVDQINNLIDTIKDNSIFKARVVMMRERFLDIKNEETGLDLVEAYIQKHNSW